MRRTVALLGVLALLLAFVGFNGLATVRADNSDSEGPVVRMARASWDTGWFQAEVYRLLIRYLGYQVDSPVTMGTQDFYEAVADGEIDLWVNGWFPTHNSLLDEEGSEVVGFQVYQGALQGYFIDRATAEEHDITNLGDLRNPAIAALFDIDGDGRADLLGCQVDWGCAAIVDYQLMEHGLTDTVEHIQGQYSPRIRDLISRYRAGDPVLYFTWTPNWIGGELVPGRDVLWLETPLPSLPPDQSSFQDSTALAGLEGCSNDPCQVGWPPNDIRAVANTAFLEAHPAIRRLLEQVVIPLEDISAQNVRMVVDESDPQDIIRHAREWVEANWGTVSGWLENADPDALARVDLTEDNDLSSGGVLRVTARPLPPFVIYQDGDYEGFEVDLIRSIAAQMGMTTEINLVDTVAKQIDDINRGVADVGLGGVAITGQREELIDFSIPVLDSGLTILVPARESPNVFDRMRGFGQAILNSDLPWLLALFALTVLVSAHLIWGLERNHNPDFAVPYRRGIWDSFYWSIVTMSTVGYGDKVARGRWGRGFALVWIALGTLIFAAFTAALASSLAVSELRGEINGPDDLHGKRVATPENSAGHTYLNTHGIGPIATANLEQTYDLLAKGEVDAVVFDAPVLRSHVLDQGDGEIITVGQEFDKLQYGLMVREENPQLLEDLNLALLRMIESGIYQRIHDQRLGPD